MKVYRLIIVCVSVVAGVTAEGCFAQSASPQDAAMTGNVQALSAVPVPHADTGPVASGKTRAEVTSELADFQNSDQAAQMRELYRGN